MFMLSNLIIASSTKEASKMPKSKTALMGLTVVCMTILCSLWIVRDSLCEFRYEDKNVNFLATLAYEVK
ncbi:Hok/Gef family protein [Vibrio lentus]